MSHAGGVRPHMRMTAALRRDIAYGHIAPGASIPDWSTQSGTRTCVSLLPRATSKEG